MLLIDQGAHPTCAGTPSSRICLQALSSVFFTIDASSNSIIRKTPRDCKCVARRVLLAEPCCAGPARRNPAKRGKTGQSRGKNPYRKKNQKKFQNNTKL
ncbi:MAG: hypothetical protein LBP73_10400 [Clostridiales Family XIII bacterium]|nr:hypothetical protein [Clostridiales Family XIII bacterium]